MKVFIRDCSSGLFYLAPDKWVQEDLARDFQSIAGAREAIRDCGRENVEVVPQGEQTDTARDSSSATSQFSISTGSSNATPQRWKFIAFVSGLDPEAGVLITNLRTLLRNYAVPQCEIEIVDVELTPELAREFDVRVLPTIVRVHPTPVRKLIGNFANEKSFVQALGL